ncbi:protein-L-isoaspartate(D-aspartate) O-methyltransferase [Sphaerisporangium sp. NPDC051011]|uniref:protein-L-isoaspartate(D-aspartate) O-methyltransferase n=1 Tax=Sphaerisporangium sp. NPDC051011 TaxID=3155792 RepID=UPI0033CEF2B1
MSDNHVWAAAMSAVPRHLFVPRRAWADRLIDQPEHLIDRDTDPAAWWKAVYSNTAIITQRGDGDVADTTSPPTSSLPCPRAALELLELLEVVDGVRVLEIGTGTGWITALLSRRLGDDHVVTVENDPQVATAAAAALAAAGQCPTVVTGEGALGHDPRAPYDRLLATCGVTDVPYAWVQQTRPGGLIVAPWMSADGQWRDLLQLHVRHGGTAIGRFCGATKTGMPRAQQPQDWPPEGPTVTSSTSVDPRRVSSKGGFRLFLAMAVPDLVIVSAGWEPLDGGAVWALRLGTADQDCWALACVWPGDLVEVYQGGGRRLWEELERVYAEWVEAGEPGRVRFRMIVGPGGQQIRLEPDVREWTVQ